jgi:hypothetical protein
MTAHPRSTNQPATADRTGQTDVLNGHIEQLMVAVEQILRAEPAGLSELALIKRLQREPWSLVGEVTFHDPAALYPVHFLVFHVLYRLRDQLAGESLALHISPLVIRLERSNIVAGSGMPDGEDKLRTFYLDLSGYELPEEDILQMVDDFWAGRSGSAPDSRELEEASTTLGFTQMPDSFPEIKQQFRRAVMKEHPDRGGDTERIQALNQAFSVLKTHFRAHRPSTGRA